jgi:Protein of unknown function (DUF3307)
MTFTFDIVTRKWGTVTVTAPVRFKAEIEARKWHAVRDRRRLEGRQFFVASNLTRKDGYLLDGRKVQLRHLAGTCGAEGSQMTTVFTLLVLFQLKHFVADYPLQSPSFFIGKFREDWGFLGPLLAHVGIHAAFTFALCVSFGASWSVALGLACFDAGVHFVMDRAKASGRYLGRWKPLTAEGWMAATRTNDRKALRGNKLFWQALGFDQMIHHLTDYAVIWWLVTQAALGDDK